MDLSIPEKAITCEQGKSIKSALPRKGVGRISNTSNGIGTYRPIMARMRAMRIETL
jgi:hypothetical protein